MNLPVVTPPEHPADQGRESTIAGVLLAAGTSSRYGDRNKLLEPIEGPEYDDAMPMVRRSTETLLAAGLEPVIVVVGHEATRVRAALDSLDVRFVENPDYEQGQGTSVGAGVRALPDVDAAVFALGDMPYVETASVGKLIAAYEDGAGSALASGYDGERGNPVLFDAAHFPALAGRDGDVGGKQVLSAADDAVVVETGDPGVRRDVDQPDDLA